MQATPYMNNRHLLKYFNPHSYGKAELDVDEELKDVEYRPVRVRGEFLHENIVYIGPKTKIHNGNVDLFSPPQENGYHVITPFKLENSEKRILVNRGWVPNNKLTPTSRKESVPTG